MVVILLVEDVKKTYSIYVDLCYSDSCQYTEATFYFFCLYLINRFTSFHTLTHAYEIFSEI